MIREVIAALMLSLVPLFVLLAYYSIRKRRAAQELTLSKPALAADEKGIDCFYVATVLEEKPLERIWAWGLGSRGESKVAYSEDKVSITRRGEIGFSFTLKRASLARATIDKGVESAGLVSLHWENNGSDLVTQLRFRSATSQRDFLNLIGYEDRVK
jgi:hypothetical protein